MLAVLSCCGLVAGVVCVCAVVVVGGVGAYGLHRDHFSMSLYVSMSLYK